MKRFGLFLVSFLISPLLFGCNGKKVNVTTNGQNCTFESKNTTALNKDFSISVTPNTGYSLSSNCFNVKVNNQDITSKTNYWTFNNNSLSIGGSYVTGDIAITANATKIKTTFNVSVVADPEVTSYDGAFPTSCVSDEDLIIKFNVEQYYGVNCTVSINNIATDNYFINAKEDYSYLTIKSDYLVGDVKINFTSQYGKISVSSNKVSIFNYDSATIRYIDPLGGKVTYECTENAFTITPIEGGLIVDSNSNNVCSEANIKLKSSNSSSVSTDIKITVYHPTNQQEALDAVTLGLIRGNTSFEITFDYDDSKSLDSFLDCLEITENMYSTLCFTYGKKPYTFYLSDSKAHGADYAYSSEKDESKYYRPVTNANAVISANESTKSASTLAIDNSLKTIKVYNSEELFWAVEHGYIPTFDSGTNGQKALQIYNLARTAVLNNTNDSMTILNECINLFNYLENLITYDYNAASSGASYPEWLKFPAYFLDGVFLNGGLAVCDGFSKAYSLLCGLDCLPVIRSFGYTAGYGSGHAWNYAKIDGEWYLVCPTWAKTDLEKTDFPIFNKNFSIFDYNSFLKSSNYFYEASGGRTVFDDRAFPLIIRSNKDCSIDVLFSSKFFVDSSEYNFIIKNDDDAVAIAKKCKEADLDSKEFYILCDASYLGSKTKINSCLANAISASGIKCKTNSSYAANSDYSYLLWFFY